MRLGSLVSSLALIVGLAVAPAVVAEATDARQFGNASSRKAVVPGHTLHKKLGSSSFVVANAVAQRGGASSQKDAITGAVVMTLIERVTNRVLKAQGIKFPSQLGGCIALLFFMLSAEVVSPGLGDSIFTNLNPGSALLAKWLPVFFVPGLAMLPLAPSIGSGMEVRLVMNMQWRPIVLINEPHICSVTLLTGGESPRCGDSWILFFHYHCRVSGRVLAFRPSICSHRDPTEGTKEKEGIETICTTKTLCR